MGRPKEHDEATRERLLDAAEHLSATHGWEALTVRRIAEEAGTSTRAVYALFASKEGLEQALHEAMFTRLRDLLQACERTRRPAPATIDLQSLAYRQWAMERPERYALAMHRFVGQRSRPRSPRAWPCRARRSASCARPCSAATTPGCCVGDRDPEDVVTHMRANGPRPGRVREPRDARPRPRGPLAGRGRGDSSTRYVRADAAAA